MQNFPTLPNAVVLAIGTIMVWLVNYFLPDLSPEAKTVILGLLAAIAKFAQVKTTDELVHTMTRGADVESESALKRWLIR